MNERAADVRLVEVSGPSALGGGWKRAWELLSLIAVTDFKRAYFDTALGYVWSIARPLMLFGVLLAVFTQVFRLGSQVPNYPVLLLFNIVLFGFFSEATQAAVTSIVSQESVVRKTQFPRLVIPLAVVLTSRLQPRPEPRRRLHIHPRVGHRSDLELAPVPARAPGAVRITTAVSMIVSSLYPRFRDTLIIWMVLSTVLFYACPILYPIEVVPETLRNFIEINPLVPLFEAARTWVIDPTAPGPAEAAGGYLQLWPPVLIYVVTCVVAVWAFRREAPRIAEQL